MAKGLEGMAHTVTLLTEENRTLRKANEALSKRRRAKKIPIRKGGALTTEDARDILAQRNAEEQVARDRRENWDGGGGRPATIRRYGTCGELGHNARTCQVD